MDVGKLPHELLERLLGQAPITDPRVLLGPRVGEDAAVIDMGDRVLVAKTDPITFATDRIGWYAVQVNANDVACMGARPRWFLATVLLPEGASERLAEDIFQQLTEACRDLDISLVGGHTEITYRLTRPIVVGHMLGETQKERVVRTGGAQVGDAVVLTKGIAIEGTSVLAREAADALALAGLSGEVIERAKGLLFQPGISVVKEALAACEGFHVHSMHDPTEGGLATGLREVALAAGVGLEVDAGAIPVLPETQAVCRALGLDPLGLLASGALLLTLPVGESARMVDALARMDVTSAVIGRVTPKERGVRLVGEEGVRDMPQFARDELARYLSGRG
ncbi:MAG: hydrogenase expression/formation protein, partial [Chloroflexi bacterium]|nr:hydrogenase expression/formation protein [Chloroflexota bacterium]